MPLLDWSKTKKYDFVHVTTSKENPQSDESVRSLQTIDSKNWNPSHLIITKHSEVYLLKEFRTLISREKIDGAAAHRIINLERNFDKMIDHRSNSSKSTRHPSDYEMLLQVRYIWYIRYKIYIHIYQPCSELQNYHQLWHVTLFAGSINKWGAPSKCLLPVLKYPQINEKTIGMQ